MRRAVVTTIVAGVSVLVLAGVVLVLLFWFAVATKDGNRIAEERVTSTSEALVKDLGYQRDVLDAETLAAEEFTGYAAEVTPVQWSGSTNDGDEALVDVRIRADVAAKSATAIFGPSNTAGSAEHCYRYRIAIYEYAERADADCDSLPTAVGSPQAETRAALPDDAETVLEAILLDGDAETLRARVLAAFADPDISIDTTVTDDGELVAAIGAAASKDCIVRVRAGDGTIIPVSFDRIWLEPGELGCVVELYTSPPL